MPGFHQTGVLCRAVSLPGTLEPIPAGRRNPQLLQVDCGTMMMLSEPSQALYDFKVYHTLSELTMGPLHGKWAYLGRVCELYPECADSVEATTKAMHLQCGPAWPCYVLYAFQFVDLAWVDLYTRRVGNSPPERFLHYQVRAVSPELWWAAKELFFLGVEDHPGWVGPPMANL